MRAAALLTSMLIATPLLAQASNPYEGPMPNTTILTGNWQLTPSDVDCTLIHRDAAGRPDLVVAAPSSASTAAFGLILPAGAPYATAMKLSVVAQANNSQNIGHVTFTPHHDRQATLLLAQWPIENLIPRIESATRFSFYATNGKQIAAVQFSGGSAAGASLASCLHGRVTGSAPPVPAEPIDHHPIDVGWVPQFDRYGCGIRRMTRNGNEFGFRYTRGRGMFAVYAIHSGPRYDQGGVVPIRFEFWQSNGDSAPVVLSNATASVTMRSTNSGNGPSLLALHSEPLLAKLRLPGLSALSISSTVVSAGLIDDVMNLSQSATAVDGMTACMRLLPRLAGPADR